MSTDVVECSELAAADGVRLPFGLWRPGDGQSSQAVAVVMVPGSARSFYLPTVRALSSCFAGAGVTCLSLSPMFSSANAFLQKYCTDDFDVARLAESVSVPLLVVSGEQEQGPWKAVQDAVIGAAKGPASAITVPSSDQWYVGGEQYLVGQ